MVANTFNTDNKIEMIKFSDIVMDLSRYEVKIKGIPAYLTHTEFKLLQYLIENSERAISREELLKEIWLIPETIETRATDDMIKRLRKKLRQYHTNAKIMTVRGFGFIMDEKSEISKKTKCNADCLEKTINQLLKLENNEVSVKIIQSGDQYEITVLS